MFHFLKSKLINRFLAITDPELRPIARIIKESMAHEQNHDPVILECNKVFFERLRCSPVALKMEFWAQHFELEGFTEYPEIKGRILDFGCGSGHLDIMLARRGLTITGVDLSTLGISIASYIRSQEPGNVQQRLSFFTSDVTVDSPLGEKYDSIWSTHVFEHIQEPSQIFRGLRGWLKPEGYLLISVPLGYAYDDPGHVNHFKDEGDLRNYLKDYVTIERINVHYDHKVVRALCKL